MTDLNVTSLFNLISGLRLQTGEKDPFWKTGQVIEGIVLERLAENIYFIRVDGKEVTVLSPYLLAKDQSITMEIQGREEGRYMVKLLNSAPAREDSAIKTAIDRMGIQDTSLNRVLVQSILAQELPLTTEVLQRAQTALKLLGGNFPEDIETALLSLKWQLPHKPRVLEVLQAFILGLRETERGSESQLFRLIENLGVLLKETPAESAALDNQIDYIPPTSEQTAPPVLSEEGKDLFRQIRHLLETITLKPEAGRAKLTEQLHSLLASQLPVSGKRSQAAFPTTGTVFSPAGGAFEPEVQQAPAAQAGVTPAPEANESLPSPYIKTAAAEKQESVPIFISKAPLPEVQEKPEQPSLTETFLKKGKHGQDSDENIKNPVERQSLLETDKGIKPESRETDIKAFSSLLEKFGRLMKELRAAVKEAGILPRAHELVLKGGAIERQMAGQQIFQSLASENNWQEYLYFNIPFVRYGETDTYGQMRIMKDTSGKKLIDPKCFSMAILLNTANLGPLVLEINVLNRDITANVKVAEEWIARVFDKAWPELQESFNAIGYSLRQCVCKVGAFLGNLQPRGFDLQADAEKLRLLDITV